MSHRTEPDPWPHRTRIVKYAAAILAAIAVPVVGSALYTATEIGTHSPTIVDAQAAPKLPRDYNFGGLASIEVTPRALPPTAAAYTPPAPVVVDEPTRYTATPTVVRLVPVPVPVPPAPQPPLHVTPVKPEPAEDEVDKPRRWEDRDGHDKHDKRDWKRDKTKPAEDTDEAEKPGRVCVERICVDGEQQDEDKPAKKRDGKRDSKESS